MTHSTISNKLEDFTILSELSTKKCQFSYIEEIRLFIAKEKAIFQTLNLFNLDNNLFIGYCWCPESQTEKVQKTLNDIIYNGRVVASCFQEIKEAEKLVPPTHFKLNDFTAPFQV